MGRIEETTWTRTATAINDNGACVCEQIDYEMVGQRRSNGEHGEE